MNRPIVRERLVERLAIDRLGEIAPSRPAASPVRLFQHRNDVDRDVPRLRIVLQPVEHRPAVHARQLDVERDGVGLVVAGHRQADVAAHRRQALEALLARHAIRMPTNEQVVLDDQDDPVVVG